MRVTAICIDVGDADDKRIVSAAREWPKSRRGAKDRQVVFLKGDLSFYSRQLDFFGVELGVAMPNNKFAYAFHLFKPTPDTRTVGGPLSDSRYFLRRRDAFEGADRELLHRAGIAAGSGPVFRFVPRALERKMIDLEEQLLRGGLHEETGTDPLRRSLYGEWVRGVRP